MITVYDIITAIKMMESKTVQQVIQSLKVYQDRGEFDGSVESAKECLELAGYEIEKLSPSLQKLMSPSMYGRFRIKPMSDKLRKQLNLGAVDLVASVPPKPRSKAACLIDAAPDLLDVCEKWISHISKKLITQRSSVENLTLNELIDQTVIAIDKSKGIPDLLTAAKKEERLRYKPKGKP